MPRQQTVVAVTAGAELIRFNAGQPRQLQSRVTLQGLEPGDRLLGIDFRVARGVLFGLSAKGFVYTIDTTTGKLTRVGDQRLGLESGAYGFDFNPAADRIRVVNGNGSRNNLRLHPDTGAQVATDPPLAYASGDTGYGHPPRVSGAAYTYNKLNEKLTTNYAIDLVRGMLLTQGTREGVAPAVSPNTGQLYTVGPLGLGPMEAVDFDIADLDNTALAAVQQRGRTRLHLLDLATGKATLLGTIGDGQPLWGLAIEP